jgi:SAM-dependent methyltransferase
VLLRQLGVTSMLDLPCGDFNWMQHVDLSGMQYVGADIVPEVVSRNQARFGNKDRRFIQADIVQGPAGTDLVFCRDCLIHFSLRAGTQCLKNHTGQQVRATFC